MDFKIKRLAEQHFRAVLAQTGRRGKHQAAEEWIYQFKSPAKQQCSHPCPMHRRRGPAGAQSSMHDHRLEEDWTAHFVALEFRQQSQDLANHMG